jgi:membrane-associated phospholipid phosphatase
VSILPSKVLLFLKKYKHAWLLSYFFFYMAWFALLEQHRSPRYWMHSPLDDLIPFQPLFIYPYLFWFLYMIIPGVYFLFFAKKTYYQMCFYLFTGMTICLMIYTVLPNGHHLRPTTLVGNGVALNLVRQLYSLDTPTNVAPSIHVYNSIGMHILINRSFRSRKQWALRAASLVTMILIILSTLFLKQHSVDDVLLALPLAILMYWLTFRVDWQQVRERYTAWSRRNNVKQAVGSDSH